MADLIFPGDLQGDDQDQFLYISIHRYRRPSRSEKNEKPKIGGIVLPIPNNLADATSVSYQQQSLGYLGSRVGTALGDTARQLGSGTMSGQGAVDRIKNAIQGANLGAETGRIAMYYGAQFAEGGGAAGALAGAVGGGAVGAALGAAAGEIIKGAMYGAGIARNPYNVQMFENVNFRSFTFNYKFVPKNQSEQVVLNNIIKTFKYHMLPGYLDYAKTFFTYPDVFEMVLNAGKSNDGPDKDNFLFKFNTCVLESVQANYHPEGYSAYHDVGGAKAPVSIQLDLSFKEIIIPGREDVVGDFEVTSDIFKNRIESGISEQQARARGT